MSGAGVTKGLKPLIPAQLDAIVPRDNIWLSASAGTGKTQVLTARVIRLLLEDDVEPENLLCITFTKRVPQRWPSGSISFWRLGCRWTISCYFAIWRR